MGVWREENFLQHTATWSSLRPQTSRGVVEKLEDKGAAEKRPKTPREIFATDDSISGNVTEINDRETLSSNNFE